MERPAMTTAPAIRGHQTIFGASGEVLHRGGWDSKNLYAAITGGDDSYWKGRRVLDIGANTSGLSIEIARHGAEVLAIEPDPYKNTKTITVRDVIRRIVSEEGIKLELADFGLFDAHSLGRFDTVLCLGLVYHFRDQQFVIDYLSTVNMIDLIVSNQTHPSSKLAMFNRLEPEVGLPVRVFSNYTEPLSGWHPTRSIFERMLEFGGFGDIVALTDPTVDFPNLPLKGVTNSAYYRATKKREIDPIKSRYQYLPR
jgi:predicted RNA methylase